MLILLVASGPQKGQVFELDEDRPRELGRHCDDLPIKDSRMSRKHARLLPKDGKWFLQDLQSTNGTYVNGRPITGQIELQNGDRVQVGSTYFVVTRLPSPLPRTHADSAPIQTAPPSPPQSLPVPPGGVSVGAPIASSPSTVPDIEPPSLDEDDILDQITLDDENDDEDASSATVVATPQEKPAPIPAAPVAHTPLISPLPPREDDDAPDAIIIGESEPAEVIDAAPPSAFDLAEPEEEVVIPPQVNPVDASTVILTPPPPEVHTPLPEAPAPSEVEEPAVAASNQETINLLPAKPTIAKLDGNVVAIMRLADLPEPLREQFMSGKLFEQRRVWPWVAVAVVLMIAALGGVAWLFEQKTQSLQAQLAQMKPPPGLDESRVREIVEQAKPQEQIAKLEQQIASASAAQQDEAKKLLEQVRTELQKPAVREEDPAMKDLLARVEAMATKPVTDGEEVKRQAQQHEATQAALEKVLAELEKQRQELAALRAAQAGATAAVAVPTPAQTTTAAPAEPVARAQPEPTPAPVAEPTPAPTPAPEPVAQVQPEPAPAIQTAPPPGAAPAPAPEVGTAQPAGSLVFLVDASGSMIDALPLVLSELSNQIAALDSSTQFSVIFFQAGRAFEIPPAGLEAASDQNKRAAQQWIDNRGGGGVTLNPQGSSNPVEALRLAMGYKPERIRVLTERITGKRQNEIDAGQLRNLLAELNPDKRTKIDTVQFFNFDDGGTLKAIAEAYGGSHRIVNSTTLSPGSSTNTNGAPPDADLLNALQ